MESVQSVSVGIDHTVVRTLDGRILGWGNMKYLSNSRTEFSYDPIDLSSEYGNI
jgi:hypothetical protein